MFLVMEALLPMTQRCDSEMPHQVILVNEVLIFSTDSDRMICPDINIKRLNAMCTSIRLTFIDVF